MIVIFSRYYYELNLRTRKHAFNKYHDIEIAELCIKRLKKYPFSEDPIYTLYYILSWMPLTNVKAIFQTNKLEEFLMKLEETHKKKQNEEIVILAQKIQGFQKINHLSEQLERISLRNEKSESR